MSKPGYLAIAIPAFLVISLLALPTATAAPLVDISSEQGVLGGLTISATNASSATSVNSTLVDLPAIVEIYSATWCTNCIETEHALEEALKDSNAKVLVYHRSKGEYEDPWGFDASDDRWIERYGAATKEAVGLTRAPPTNVFHGGWVKVGSSPNGASLEEDYSTLLANQHTFSAATGSSSLSWSGGNGSGALSWAFSINSTKTDVTWVHRVMVLETMGYFAGASNKLVNNSHIVRAMFDLPADSGSMDIELPAAWDGDDLSLVLLHEWTDNTPQQVVQIGEDSGFLGLPTLPATLSLLAIVAAGVVVQRRQPEA